MQAQRDINILLVDDHPLVRDGLRARLETIPRFSIAGEASNAEEAMLLAATREIDLVLMDINLSGMNGIELTGRFNTLHPEIAVLMLSMHDNAKYVIQSIQAGARGYVLKDAPADNIITAIHTIMSGEIYYSASLSRYLSSVSTPPTLLLTPREQEVLHGVTTGKSNKQIARELNLSVRTVETHRLNIKRKIANDSNAGSSVAHEKTLP
jgi:DNA-binding NarL/FixJ family response regulator